MKLRSSALLWLVPFAVIAACSSSDDNEGDPMGAGGMVGGGGFVGNGGALANGGQVTGNGGQPPGNGGQPPGNGGQVGMGGFDPGAGGGPIGAGGGPQGNGGSVGNGGQPAGTGGTPGGNPGNPGGTEYTFTTGHFTVPPGGEVYKCQDFPNPFGKDVGVVEMNTDLTPGSHHMFAFLLPGAGGGGLTGSLQNCPGGGVEFHDYLTTSGSPHQQVLYKEGIGRIFRGDNSLRLNVHLFNTSGDARDAFVTFKIRYVDPNTLPKKAASIFLNNISVAVPANSPSTTVSKSYALPYDINLMGAASHMHKQGVHFVAKASSGETLYDGTEWQEPPPKVFDPPLLLKAGTTITWSCTYNNQGGPRLTFGESAATNEMCIFPGEFWTTAGIPIEVQAF